MNESSRLLLETARRVVIDCRQVLPRLALDCREDESLMRCLYRIESNITTADVALLTVLQDEAPAPVEAPAPPRMRRLTCADRTPEPGDEVYDRVYGTTAIVGEPGVFRGLHGCLYVRRADGQSCETPEAPE